MKYYNMIFVKKIFSDKKHSKNDKEHEKLTPLAIVTFGK